MKNLFFVTLLFASFSVFSQDELIEDLNPFSADISQQLQENDLRHSSDRVFSDFSYNFKASCYRETCPVYINAQQPKEVAHE